MKILAINASHRGDRGYTRLLIDRLFAGASAAGADCEVITLARLKINRCLACNRCETPDHYLRCVFDGKDDVSAIFAKMATADIIVYATPVYVFSMSGLMKTFLDRINSTADCRILRVTQSGLLFHHTNPSICSKPFVTLVCCDNFENDTPANILDYFRRFSRFMDAPQVGTLVRSGGSMTGQGKDPAREAKFLKMRQVYAAYNQAGRELALEGRIRRSTQRRANQEILPVPFFSWIKRIRFKPFKDKFVERARLWQ